MSNIPFFSIIVPTYNQAQYLGLALDSIIAQTDPDWEAIIVNDGSTDSTPEVLEDYANKEKRFKVIHQKNGGVGSALNVALKLAQGQWICWLSSDDLFIENKLEIHRDWIKQYPDCSFFFSDFKQLNNTTGEILNIKIRIPQQKWQIIELLKSNYYLAGISICIKRESWLKVGFFNEALRYAQDNDMWLRLLADYPGICIPQATCIQRIHPEQDSNRFLEACFFDSAKSGIDFLNRHKLNDLFPTVNLNDFQVSKQVIKKSLAVAAEPNIYIYQLGWHPLLLLRIAEWIFNDCPKKDQDYFKKLIKNYSINIIKKYNHIPLGFWWAYLNEIEKINIDNLQYISIDALDIVEIHYSWLQCWEFERAEPLKKYLEKFHNYHLEIKNYSEVLKELFYNISEKQEKKIELKQIENKVKLRELNLIDKLLIMEEFDFSLKDIKKKILENSQGIKADLLFFWVLINRIVRLLFSNQLISKLLKYKP